MRILILLVFASFATISFSQQTSPPQNMRQLTDQIQAIMKEENMTGLMLGITTKDSVLFSGGFGYADLGTGRMVDENTLFRMGSITKMFVSLGIMKLVHEGKLNLDDEVLKIAPEVPLRNEWERTDPVRLVHLLEHTSGFDDMKLNRLYSLDTIENTGIEMMLVQKNSLVCRWRPGERFAYSNPNYSVLGYIIEKMSGKDYHQYLAENILMPVGMNGSNFNPRSHFPSRDVKEYVIRNGKAIVVQPVTMLSGAQGALWSGSADMLQFLQLFLRGGHPVVPAAVLNEIETPHSSLAVRAGQKNGYALGNMNSFFLNMKYPFRGHEGITGTCFSSCKYNRELGVGFVVSSNCNNNNYRIEEAIVSYLERNAAAPVLATAPIDQHAIEPFLGRYQFESPRFELSGFSDKLQNAPLIYIDQGKLYFKPLLGEPAELVQTAPFTFAWKDSNMPFICFTKNLTGKKVMMIGGAYYEQVSNSTALLKRIMIVTALLFTLSTFFLGFVSLFAAATRTLSWSAAAGRLLPMIAVSLLVYVFTRLAEMQFYSYRLSELNTANVFTLTIFASTLFFALTSIVSLYISLVYLKRSRIWFSVYLLLMSLSLCVVTSILWQNGWIGLRTWAL
jgi:CubicO group peptidase (beta-lactamase class C family)